MWAAGLAGRGVGVNTVTPGPTDTPGLKGLAADPDQAQALFDHEAARTALGRVGRPEEIANAVLFLATDQASFMTASQLYVDGGEVHTHS